MTTEPFGKRDDYYATARTDIVHMIPDGAARVLEIGCGSGNTLAHLKSIGKGTWHGGVEINETMAAEAKPKVDRLWTGAIEDVLADAEGLGSAAPFDAVLCLDVLEHLLDPWTVLEGLAGHLAPGGTAIVSIPNIRFHKALLPLLLRGDWAYEERGVLDSTHLRFFTRKTAMELVRGAGLEVVAVEPSMALKRWKNKWILNKISGGRLTDFYAYNYRIVGRKVAG